MSKQDEGKSEPRLSVDDYGGIGWGFERIAGASTLAGDLAKLQADIHQLREDYRDVILRGTDNFDTRLNKIEADLGDCISRARGES